MLEGYSRKLLAGMVSPHQDLTAVLQILYVALSEYGCPKAIVSDDGIPTRWWLEPIEHAPNTYAETDPEAADASVAAYVDISF
ncbi:hypothetical protein C2W62_54115, partial [Candidatus Entotheonella serta]